MKFNELIAISTAKALLVPYDRRHVLTYHAWMEDPAIQEATASERLTLEEEYENQESWRASRDKLTFIICQPLPLLREKTLKDGVALSAGTADAPDNMVGDVNVFLYPYDNDDDDDTETPSSDLVGEIDIMIADSKHRGQGLGRAAVLAFLHYIARNLDGVLREYSSSKEGEEGKKNGAPPATTTRLKRLMAKIHKDNAKSIALFRSLGFEQEGDVNYFGELKLVHRDLEKLVSANNVEGYVELVYERN
ncbi:GNAT domain-containing protein [Podospora didyma]|uniref:GNAT domain-containing protein n=1 Tax=Podospora didyma TaxID=330526 RepID=A0AAE0KJD3_9PEZI|nr:GNAT domain-containing protein [Podospora didyma]